MTGEPHDKSVSGKSGHGGSDDGHGHAPQEKKPWPPLIKIFLSLCVVLVVLDFWPGRPEKHHGAEHLYGFYPLYGFVACVLLVLAATQMRKVLMREEDYYDAD